MKAYKIQLIGYARRHNEDTQLYGMQRKHALTCAICGADLPRDMAFQQAHMEHAHKMEC